jgi:Rho guanine nucleotide exchange factor 7
VCTGVRRQKQLQLEVLSGSVRNWEGEDVSTLGDILHMGSVAVGPTHSDRYLVLFPKTLLVLAVSTRMSGFIYQVRVAILLLYKKVLFVS